MRGLMLLISVVCLLVSVAGAAAPNLVNYQGQLSSAGGTPLTGTYNLTFRIYNVPSGGTEIWGEIHSSVAVNNGLFSVMLGSVDPVGNPLNPAVFEDSLRYLGITVGADPEMTPRIRMAASAYSLRTATVDQSSGGTINGVVNIETDGTYPPEISLGGPINRQLHVTAVGDGKATICGSSMPSYEVRNEGGFLTGGLYHQYGLGALLLLRDDTGAVKMTLDASQSGDFATVLPNDAINSLEMSDEPGLVSTAASTSDTFATTMQDLTTVTISTPAPGYIHLTGRIAELDMWGTTGQNWVLIQIDETAGGNVLVPYYAACGSYSFPSTAYSFYSPYVERTFYKPAGTYTFRLEGVRGFADPGGAAQAYYPTLTATFFPTSYGPVMTVAGSSEAGQFEGATAVDVSAATPASGVRATTVYSADLRQLEVKAAQAEAAAQKAKLELTEARLKLQEPTATTAK